MWLVLLLFPWIAFSDTSLLSRAEEWINTYAQTTAKRAPPSSEPATSLAQQRASVWFSVDLNHLAQTPTTPPLQQFATENSFSLLRDLGIEAIEFSSLRNPKTGEPDPHWGNWTQTSSLAGKKGFALIGRVVGNATEMGSDFLQATRGVEGYEGLYHLIEIPQKDWKLLPSIAPGKQEANIPWLTLQLLQKEGYIPEKTNPYTKESAWNVTDKIVGLDGKARRWIYLKQGQNQPVLAWLSPSFAAYRLFAGDALYTAFELSQKILHLDGRLPQIAQEMETLWVRKIGAFSLFDTNGTIASMQKSSADLLSDTVSRPALLHALLCEDAGAMRLIFRLLQTAEIEPRRLVHALQPFDEYVCDWIEFLNHPKKQYAYFEEQVTGELLQRRLMKEDLIRMSTSERIPLTTWVDYCARALQIEDFEKQKELLTRAHLLLSFSYAMQPGVFSFSMSDLLGALPSDLGKLDLFSPNSNTLYSSLPTQLKNPRSFASQLKAILFARRECGIAFGEYVDLLPSPHPGTLLAQYRLPQNRLPYVLALNFSKQPVRETIELTDIHNTTAIDVMTQLAEEKAFSSSRFSFMLPPLSGRAFYFQPKHY